MLFKTLTLRLNRFYKFPLMRMGVLAPRICARSAPHRRAWKLFCHVSASSYKSYTKFQNPMTTLSTQKMQVGPWKIIWGGILLFVWLRANTKFINPWSTHSWRKVIRWQERREKEKTTFIVATIFCLQRPRSAHALRSDQQTE